MDKLLTTKDVCSILQVSPSLVYKWVHYGYIPHIKIGSLIRFKGDQIERWVRVKVRRAKIRTSIALL
jgi:excisionase family DNA binding protein